MEELEFVTQKKGMKPITEESVFVCSLIPMNETMKHNDREPGNNIGFSVHFMFLTFHYLDLIFIYLHFVGNRHALRWEMRWGQFAAIKCQTITAFAKQLCSY